MKSIKRITLYSIFMFMTMLLISQSAFAFFPIFTYETRGGRVTHSGLPAPLPNPITVDPFVRQNNEETRVDNRMGSDFTFYPVNISLSNVINLVPKLKSPGGSEVGLGVSLAFNNMAGGWYKYFFDFETRCVLSLSLMIIDPKGNKLFFEEDRVVGNITYYKPVDSRASKTNYSSVLLKVNPSSETSEIIWEHKDGTKYYYEKNMFRYRLAKISDRNENSLFYHYGMPSSLGRDFCTKITDSSGRSIDLTYDDFERVDSITDPAGRLTTLEYKYGSNSDNVTNIKFPDGSEIKFEYTGSNNLRSVITPNGHTFSVQYTMDTDYMTGFTAPDGQIDFTTGERVKYITDKKGNVWKYLFDMVDGLYKIEWYDSSDQSFSPHSLEFTRPEYEDLLTSFTDLNGNTMHWEYSPTNGKVVRYTDGNNLTSSFEYGEYAKLTKMTDPMGKIWERKLDAAGNVTEITDPLGNITKHTYDSFGNMTSKTDPNGNTTTYEYDLYGNVISVTDPLGNRSIFTYDVMGNKLTATDAKGNTTSYEYDSMDRVTVITYADGKTKSYTYDFHGNKKTETDENGNTTEYNYNFNDQVVEVIDANGNTIETEYDVFGNKIREKDKKGNITTWAYDFIGRPISETDALGNTTYYSYAGNSGNSFIEGGKDVPTKVVNKRGYETKSQYDSGYRLIKTTDAKGGVVTTQYDDSGNVRFMTDQNGLTTEKQYDLANKPVKVMDPMGHITESVYDANGNVIEKIDANGNKTKYSFDERNKLVEVADALDRKTQYTYDAVGNRLKVKDAKGNATKYRYNNRNRLRKAINPLGDFALYKYDGVGNKSQITDENGNTTKFIYDELNRIKQVVFPDLTTREYTYDLNSNLLKAEDSSGVIEYAYDILNRVNLVKNSKGKDTSYTYNENSLRTSMNVNGVGTVNYSYDELDRLVSQTDFDGKTNSFTYDSAGRRTSMTQGNGIKTSYSYDNANRLLAKTSPVLSLNYTYDNVGNILSMTDDTGATAYTYDTIYRLTGVSYPDGSQESFTYDAVGNRLGKVIDGVQTDYQYNAFNQLTEMTQGDVVTEYKYDKHGNLKQKTVNETVTELKGKKQKPVTKTVSTKTNYVYNFEYDLVNINRKGQACSFSYDAEGRRIARTPSSGEAEAYIYDGLNIIADLKADGTIKAKYNTELQLDQMLSVSDADGKRYYHTDHLGSIRKLTDGSKSVIADYTYEAFGKKKTAPEDDTSRYSFTGREDEDEFGLMYYRARYYDPDTGRFISPDAFTRGPDDPRVSYRNSWYSKVHGEATLYGEWLNPHSFNRYLYCNNNPVGATDPLGLYEYDTTSTAKAFLHEVNPFNADGTFWKGTAAYADGYVPFFNPLGKMGAYDQKDSSYKISGISGSITRDLLMVIGGGGIANALKANGQSLSIGQRLFLGEVGPSTMDLYLSGGEVTARSIITGYGVKSLGRLDTTMKLYDAINEDNHVQKKEIKKNESSK